jgi:cytochrome c2
MEVRSHIIYAGLIALLFAPTATLAQEGDPAAGKQVFNKCRACHEAETDRNKVGPTLLDVVGKRVRKGSSGMKRTWPSTSASRKPSSRKEQWPFPA